MPSQPLDLHEACAPRLLVPETGHEAAAHLQACDAWSAELAAREDTIAQLAYAAPSKQPPADLEERLMARVGALRHAEGSAQVAPAPPAPRNAPTPRAIAPRHTATWVSVLGAIAALVVLAVLPALSHTSTTTLAYRQQLAQQARAALGALNAPVAFLRATSEGPSEAVAVLATDSATNRGALVVGRMPMLRASQTYEFWLVRRVANQVTTTTPAGTLTVGADGSGELAFRASAPLSQLQSAGISIERAGGVAQPDSPMLMLLDADAAHGVTIHFDQLQVGRDRECLRCIANARRAVAN